MITGKRLIRPTLRFGGRRRDKQQAYLKKELRILYDMRSGFSHGGRDVAHPMSNEALDERVSDEYRKLMDASEFGFAVVLTSIQRLIEKELTDFTFQEALVDPL